MKPLNPYTIINLLLLAVLCLCSTMIHAQTLQQKTVADSATAKLSTRLSISKEKAGQIQAAYNYRRADIDRLVKDKQMNPLEKQRQLKQLLAERSQQIDAVLSPAQKTALNNASSAEMVRAQAKNAEIKQRHEQQLSRMPHKTLSTIKKQ